MKKKNRWEGWEAIRHPRFDLIVGYVKGKVFAWEIKRSKHLLYKHDEGVAKDAEVINMLMNSKFIDTLRIYTDRGEIYEIPLIDFFRLKEEINYFPHGKQYTVPLRFWKKIGEAKEKQLPLWE